MAPPENAPRPSPPWPLKLLLGCLVAVLAAALVLGALEGGLRLAGHGRSPRFWRVETGADGIRWLRENREVTAPFFAPELIRRPQPFRLPLRKSPGTYRVFVLGSSAAMGDPEPSFSLGRMLEVLLRSSYPDIRFEVVNAGITAVNSHVVRGVAADCAALEPDLFVVYEGHNEVIGPFGPGTVFAPFLGSPGAVRLAIRLRGTRTGQLVAAAARRFGGGRTVPARWGGMEMFLSHGLAADDPRLATMRELFRQNLAAVAESGRRAGATVMLCTVAANRRDFPPFVSWHRPGLEPEALARWQAAFDAGNAALAAGADATALARYDEALELDDRFAELHFRRGRAFLRLQRLPEARAALQKALDTDALRFRADSGLNEAVRSFAVAPEPGVEVVDLAAAADAAARDGVAGDDLFYEHVHLNFNGTYRLALDLWARVGADLRRRGLVPENRGPAVPADVGEVRRRLGYTTYEQAMIVKEMLARLERPPFATQAAIAARRSAYAAMEATALERLARPESGRALTALYEEALAAAPDDWVLHRNYGMACVGLGLAEKAREELELAIAVIPDDPDTLFALARAHRALGDAGGEGAVFARLRLLEPRYPGLPPAVGRAVENETGAPGTTRR